MLFIEPQPPEQLVYHTIVSRLKELGWIEGQNLSIERFAAASGLPVLPVVVLLEAPPPGLAPVSERPDAGIAKHLEYAFTWFALAATAAALWLALNLKRARP